MSTRQELDEQLDKRRRLTRVLAHCRRCGCPRCADNQSRAQYQLSLLDVRLFVCEIPQRFQRHIRALFAR